MQTWGFFASFANNQGGKFRCISCVDLFKLLPCGITGITLLKGEENEGQKGFK